MRRVLVGLLAALTAVVAWAGVAPPAGAAGEIWAARNAPPGAWKGVAVNGDGSRFVAVGTNVITTSTDGVTWTPSADPVATGGSWTSVTFGNGKFVAVGNGRAATSTNGTTWVASADTTLQSTTWTSVTANAGGTLFVAVASGKAITSPDGADWTDVAGSSFTGTNWASVTYGNNSRFVAVGNNKTLWSTDGTTWTAVAAAPVAGTTWTAVAAGTNKFVAVATDKVMTSADGATWTAVGSPLAGSWSAIAYTGTQYVAVASAGANRVMTSPDGSAWTARTGATLDPWTGVAGDSALVVAVGTNAVMSSADGFTWTDRAVAANTGWTGIGHGNGLYVAVSGSASRPVMTSPDGVVWTAQAAPSAAWKSVAYGNGTWVAVATTGGVMTSHDGVVWTNRTPPAANQWQAVAFGNGLFVAVSANGTNRVMTSPDGVAWTLSGDADANGGVWSSVTYGNGAFVVVGNAKAVRSTDGTAWADIADADVDAGSWTSVGYGGGRFVMVGNAKALTSTNGTDWTVIGDGDIATATWTAVTFGVGTWVAVSTNAIITSTDAATWTPRTSPANSSWSALAHGSGVFTAVASGGGSRVMTSGAYVAPPTISSFLPDYGLPGTVVTITGTNLLGASSVTFGGIEGTDISVASATQMTAVVPAGAASGKVTVTTPGGTATGEGDFTVATGNRIFGADAIDTSIAIAQTEFPDAGVTGTTVDAQAQPADAVVLARSDYFADALAGGPLAASVNGPLLITPGTPQSSEIDPRVLAEINRLLNPGQTVYILGGPLAISGNVDATLTAAGYKVERVSGANMFATAVAIANVIGSPSTILEATGQNFPDALSAVPAAIKTDGVILLTNNNVQAPETQAYINAHPAVPRFAIGGPLVAAGADPGATAVYGQDLYGTSAAVATRWFTAAEVYGVATGANFPDALSGGVFMATGGRMGPVVLVPPALPLPSTITAYLGSLDPGTPGYVFGGPLAISDPVVAAVLAAVG